MMIALIDIYSKKRTSSIFSVFGGVRLDTVLPENGDSRLLGECTASC